MRYNTIEDITFYIQGAAPVKYTVSYCSERGKNKQACEDSALIGRLVVNDEAGTAEVTAPCCICLCDGVGGCAGGREASAFVAGELSTGNCPESAADVKDLFIEINNGLLERARNSADHKRMGTTATALCSAALERGSEWAV